MDRDLNFKQVRIEVELPAGDIDVLAVGETVVDLISVKESDDLAKTALFRRYQGGSPANLAVNVARLGRSSALISKVGKDSFGRFLQQRLSQSGVDTRYLKIDPGVRTSAIFISRTTDKADSIAYRHGDYRLQPQEIPDEAIHRARIVHASTFALSLEPCRSAIERVFRLAREQNKLVSLDPNYNPPIWPDRREAWSVLQRIFPYVQLTKPSLEDCQRIFGGEESPESYIRRFHELGPNTVILTMGADGAIVSYQGEMTHIAAREIHVMDATGAGDAFWAGFLVALLDGHSPIRSALFAREIAEQKLTSVGALTDNIDRFTIYERLYPSDS